MAVTGGGGAFVVPTVGLSFSPTTTPAQFAAYLSTLPGLQAAGAVTVSGTSGGPFNVAFGPGVTGGKSLAVINNAPATITQQVNTGTPGANQWNPVNDESGLILNGLVINNSGAGAAPWYLSGNAVSINNTDTTLTSGITNTTVAYPTNPGVVPPGNSPITTVITLGQNAPVNGPLTLNSAATITDDGPAATSVVGTQSSLLITSNINLNGNTLSVSPSAATTLNQTRDTGLTVLAGTIMNADVVTFTAPDTVTFAYLAQQAAVPGFIYTAATTAAQFATYLATLPGLAALTPANVFGPSGGPFVVNLGAATPTGTALSVLSGSAVISFTSMATNNAVVEAGYGVLTLDGNNSYEGRTSITSGVLVDGAANGLGNTFGAGKSVNPSNPFPIPGLASPGAALRLATGGDAATYNYDLLNFAGGAGTVTLSYAGQLATPADFAYTTATTAAHLATYLTTLPGLAGAVNVIGAPGGPFYVIFGGGVVGGNLLQYAGGPAVIITPSSAGIAIIGPGLLASAPFGGLSPARMAAPTRWPLPSR